MALEIGLWRVDSGRPSVLPTQTVLLYFAGLSWPRITAATLTKA